MEHLEKLPISVLLVEDDIFIQAAAKIILSQIVKQVDVVPNGEAGIEFYHEFLPDVIISDITMPVMDGLTMSRQLLQENPDINIIFLTSYRKEELILDAINMGVRGFLTKPLQIGKVYKLLEKFYHILENKQELEKYTNRIRAIFDSQESMVVTADEEKILSVNKSLLHFYGFINQEDLLKNYPKFLDLFPETEKIYIQNIVNNPSFFQSREKKVKLTDKVSGNRHVFLVKYNFIPDQNMRVFTFTDITEIEEKRMSLEQKAFTDDLTKVYNRVKFCDMFEYEHRRMQREKASLSLLMFDIDFFKTINDTFGHKVGDDVLVNLAIIVQKTIRRTDIFARWGGEEFMILLPSTSIDGAFQLGEKIRSRIQESDFGVAKAITISIGITTISEEDTLDIAIQRVDAALYAAKHSGRNKSEIKH